VFAKGSTRERQRRPWEKVRERIRGFDDAISLLFLSAGSLETFYVKPSIHQVWSVAEKAPQASLLSWSAGATPAGVKCCETLQVVGAGCTLTKPFEGGALDRGGVVPGSGLDPGGVSS
jgi:hypothetical protein